MDMLARVVCRRLFLADCFAMSRVLLFQGKYANSSAHQTCDPCAAGTSQVLDGRSICDACSIGKYNGQLSQPLCALCPVGQTTNTTGQTTCALCNTG
jgi:hypothetical protein